MVPKARRLPPVQGPLADFHRDEAQDWEARAYHVQAQPALPRRRRFRVRSAISRCARGRPYKTLTGIVEIALRCRASGASGFANRSVRCRSDDAGQSGSTRSSNLEPAPFSWFTSRPECRASLGANHGDSAGRCRAVRASGVNHKPAPGRPDSDWASRRERSAGANDTRALAGTLSLSRRRASPADRLCRPEYHERRADRDDDAPYASRADARRRSNNSRAAASRARHHCRPER